MRSRTAQALLVSMLLLLAGCSSARSGNLAPPLVFPTQVQGASGPAPLSLYYATIPSGPSPKSTVTALTASNGAMRWTYNIPVQVQDDVFLESGILYFGAADQKVYALDAGSGRMRWSVKIGGFPVIAEVMDGVIYGTMVSNAIGQFNGGSLFALNARDGSARWHSQVTGRILGAVESVIYVGGSTDNTLYALNASDGSVRWKFQAAYTPLELDVEQGKVYMLAILLNSSNQLAVFYALNASTGAQQWQYPKDPNTPVSISLVGADNNAAYLITSSNQNSSMTNSALALKADDGTELWHYQLTAQYHNFDSSALDGGVVYLGANDGNLYALNASDGKLRWQTQVGHSYTSVELVNGDMIYVAILQEGFVAVNSKDGSMHWRYQSGASMQAVAVENGLLYGVLSNNGFSSDPDSYAVAFNTADGTIFWKYDNGQTPFFPVVG